MGGHGAKRLPTNWKQNIRAAFEAGQAKELLEETALSLSLLKHLIADADALTIKRVLLKIYRELSQPRIRGNQEAAHETWMLLIEMTNLLNGEMAGLNIEAFDPTVARAKRLEGLTSKLDKAGELKPKKPWNGSLKEAGYKVRELFRDDERKPADERVYRTLRDAAMQFFEGHFFPGAKNQTFERFLENVKKAQ